MSNKEVFDRTGFPSMDDWMIRKKLRLAGNLMRMPHTRLPNQTLFSLSYLLSEEREVDHYCSTRITLWETRNKRTSSRNPGQNYHKREENKKQRRCRGMKVDTVTKRFLSIVVVVVIVDVLLVVVVVLILLNFQFTLKQLVYLNVILESVWLLL